MLLLLPLQMMVTLVVVAMLAVFVVVLTVVIFMVVSVVLSIYGILNALPPPPSTSTSSWCKSTLTKRLTMETVGTSMEIVGTSTKTDRTATKISSTIQYRDNGILMPSWVYLHVLGFTSMSFKLEQLPGARRCKPMS